DFVGGVTASVVVGFVSAGGFASIGFSAGGFASVASEPETSACAVPSFTSGGNGAALPGLTDFTTPDDGLSSSRPIFPFAPSAGRSAAVDGFDSAATPAADDSVSSK